MRLSRLLAVAFVVVLVPTQALALCFKDQFNTVYIFDVPLISASGFGLLLGEAVGGSGNFPITSGTSFGLVGSGHLRADSKVHFNFSVAADDPDNFPFWVQGTLDPPGFTSGAGYADTLGGFFSALTFSASACPALPQ